MNTSNSNRITISVKDYFNESISSRDAIALLFNRKFEPQQEITIDFSEIVFITRSAAHQLLKEIERVEERFKCKVSIVSADTEVSNMMRIVKESLVQSVKQQSDVHQVFFSSTSELKRFLMQF